MFNYIYYVNVRVNSIWILHDLGKSRIVSMINLNKSCIWIKQFGAKGDKATEINLNKSCIWMQIAVNQNQSFYWLTLTRVVFESISKNVLFIVI